MSYIFSQLILVVADQAKSHYYTSFNTDDNLAELLVLSDYSKLEDILMNLEPEIIVLDDSFFPSFIELLAFCKNIRKSCKTYRPAIVVISNSNNLEHKIQAFKSGADDYLLTDISQQELNIRFFAHIRRHLEESSDPVTSLPQMNLIIKTLKRSIESSKDWSLLSLSLHNIDEYISLYGRENQDKLLKAFAAIVSSAISQHDFIGTPAPYEFIIMTDNYRGEIVAKSICSQFDAIIHKFYSKEDAERSFVVLSGYDQTTRKVGFVSVNIGLVSNKYKKIGSYVEALALANSLKNVAKTQIGSRVIVNRPSLSYEKSLKDVIDRRKHILIIEEDAALAYLLSATLELQGYSVDATSNSQDVIELIDLKLPSLIIIEPNIHMGKGWQFVQQLKSDDKTKYIPIILTSVLQDKEKALLYGGDLYLQKPFELVSLFTWINKLLT